MSDLIYLACPYSHDDPSVRRERFRLANEYAGRLMNAGLLIFSPISHTHPIAEEGELPLGWEFWERCDRTYLDVCRAMIVLKLDGWAESKGVSAEIRIMDEMRKPVYYLGRFDADGFTTIVRVLAQKGA